MKHIPRKRFGQHFLSDSGIIDAIVHEIAPQPGQAMVEIGPGLAALTQPLVERLGQLTVIELDRDLAQRLRDHPQLQVIESDVLRVDFSAILRPEGSKLRVVGNLPYNISTPILFHLLDHVAVIEDQHFMLQKEVVDRMVARPATSDYSRLSVMLQWRYAMANVLFVPPTSFDPPPRVDSAVVRMVPLATFAPVDVKNTSALWCKWLSASAANCCATPWAAGWKTNSLPAASTCSAAPRKCRWMSTWHWHKPRRREEARTQRASSSRKAPSATRNQRL